MLSHIDDHNQPRMVDVAAKAITERRATAQARLQLPPSCRDYLQGEELVLKKGPVFQTAIIAGTMAVKKTADAIPFCHPLPIEGCKFTISMTPELVVTILCEVKTTGKTGVEMEALHGASVAALTIYDMCKALSHAIAIEEIRLVAKSGGKRTIRPLYGLVLTGGFSRRMQRDKALIEYHGKPQAQYLFELLNAQCDRVFLSARPGQWLGTELAELPHIEDQFDFSSPLNGLVSAMTTYPDVDWLVLACDLAQARSQTLTTLLEYYRSDAAAICYHNAELDIPEALCAIYTPAILPHWQAAIAEGRYCPVKIVRAISAECVLVTPQSAADIANINTPGELENLQSEPGV